MTTTPTRHERWSENRSCARCGHNAGPDGMVHSIHTGAWYCGDPDACTARADQPCPCGAELAYTLEPATTAQCGCTVPIDPEYADVDDAGQLSLGVPGEQRTLDGLAPAAHPTITREELAR